jgi:dethiobiotin synthetase
MNAIFITGTDTGIGKTHVSVQLLRQFNKEGYRTFGIKPIASGCFSNAEGELVNEDALALQKEASIKKPYSIVNPFAFEEPIAPHLAAKLVGSELRLSSVLQRLSQSIQSEADINIIEGVGGWSVPLNDFEMASDIVKTLQIPTILVVGIKLGCLNHAILTHKNIVHSGVPFLGWVANCVDPEALVVEGIIDSLTQWLGGSPLVILPYGKEHNTQINLAFLDRHIVTPAR